MPETISPQLATLVGKPPSGENWLHEIKLDGYRIIAFKHGKQVRLMSRNNKDWTTKFQTIMKAIEKIPITRLILDGEIVLFDEQNRSSFQLLQNALDSDDNSPFIYYVFDLLYYDKWDVRSLSLLDRKALLEPLLTSKIPNLHFSDYILGEGKEIFAYACDLGLEGIVSKFATSTYITRRSKSWLKVKCLKRQEFVIGGFSPPKNSRNCFGSLFLGLYDKEGNFIYNGNVGTGFSEASLRAIYEELKNTLLLKT
uniref:non-homologous end-joining DNA ligase n=1 Tax=Legionella tunisiensis TaxID=1034944 RepID=UPI0018DB3A2F